MQSLRPPQPHWGTGVFQNLIDAKYAAGASAWYWWQEPFWIWSMIGQAFVFAGVSPNPIACWACALGVEMYRIQRYAQFGCGAFFASIHVSAQPVAPSFGIRSRTGTLESCSVI